MGRRHLDQRLLERLLRGEASPAEVRELAWHLAEACPDCARAAGVDRAPASESGSGALEASRESRLGGDREGAQDDGISFERVRRRLGGTMALLSRQRAEAPALADELERHPPERQRLLVRNNPRFQILPVAELLLERAWALGFEQPGEAEPVAELAAEVLDRVEAGAFGEEVLHDLRARSWAYRGNFRRIRTDFRGADQAFRRAEALLMDGSGDLLEQARLCGLRATLCRDRFQFEEARELLQKALRIYVATDETHLAGRSMIELGTLATHEDRHDQAVVLFEQGLARIDAGKEPRLVLVALYNIVHCLINQGRFEEALALLPRVRRSTVEWASRFDLVRLRWLEGRILLGLGHEARAEAAFLEVRKGYADQGLGYDAATVGLELAALYLRQGRHGEIKQLAVEMLPVFQSRDIHQEAIAALLLFQRAVERETLTLRTVEEVAEAVRRSQGKAAPRSEEPS